MHPDELNAVLRFYTSTHVEQKQDRLLGALSPKFVIHGKQKQKVGLDELSILCPSLY